MDNDYLKVLYSEKWKVIQNVIFPIKSILNEELIATSSSLYISLHIQRHNSWTMSGLSVTEQILEITHQTPFTKNIQVLFDYVIDAQYIEYCVRDNNKEHYSFKVFFEKDSYTINIIGKKYLYGTSPQPEDLTKIKEIFRNKLGLLLT